MIFGLAEFADVPNVAAICVYPPFVNLLKKELVDKNIQIASVCASFPSSQTFLSVKKAECLQTIKSGANELDIVISIGTFLEGSLDIVFNEIAEIKKIAKKPHLKVSNLYSPPFPPFLLPPPLFLLNKILKKFFVIPTPLPSPY